MGMMSFKARPLTFHSASQNVEDYSPVFDLEDPFELHDQVKLTAVSSTLTVAWQRSIDGLYWEEVATADYANPGANLINKTVSADIYRFLRFKYVFGSGNGTATFEIDVYTKNFS